MEITQQVRDYAASLEQGMQEKSAEFVAQGAQVYRAE
jgi:phosphomethylpyrimidine synthase